MGLGHQQQGQGWVLDGLGGPALAVDPHRVAGIGFQKAVYVGALPAVQTRQNLEQAAFRAEYADPAAVCGKQTGQGFRGHIVGQKPERLHLLQPGKLLLKVKDGLFGAKSVRLCRRAFALCRLCSRVYGGGQTFFQDLPLCLPFPDGLFPAGLFGSLEIIDRAGDLPQDRAFALRGAGDDQSVQVQRLHPIGLDLDFPHSLRGQGTDGQQAHRRHIHRGLDALRYGQGIVPQNGRQNLHREGGQGVGLVLVKGLQRGKAQLLGDGVPVSAPVPVPYPGGSQRLAEVLHGQAVFVQGNGLQFPQPVDLFVLRRVEGKEKGSR